MDSSEIYLKTRAIFKKEASEILLDLDTALLELENDPSDTERINRVFRSMHTLKGSGATSGFQDLSGFLHEVEEVYNFAREGKLTINSEIIDSTLRACDVVNTYLEAGDETTANAVIQENQAIVETHRKFLPSSSDTDANDPKTSGDAGLQEPDTAFSVYTLTFKPHLEIFFSGSDLGMYLDDLRTLGYAQITAHTDEIPPLDTMNPEHCYLAWTIHLLTESDEERVREVFMFIEDECELNLEKRPYETAPVFEPCAYFDGETVKDYTEEALEHLNTLESTALVLEQNPADASILDNVFRALHNLKGSSQLLLSQVSLPLPRVHPLLYIERMTHSCETIIEIHRGKEDETAESISAFAHQLLEVADALRTLIHAFQNGDPADEEMQALLDRITSQLPDTQEADSTDNRFSLATTQLNPRDAVFVNTLHQCLTPLESLTGKMKPGGLLAVPEWKTGIRLLETLGQAIKHFESPALNDPLSTARSLAEEKMSRGGPLSTEESQQLQEAIDHLKDALQAQENTLVPPVPDTPSADANTKQSPVESTAKAPDSSTSSGSNTSGSPSVRVDQDKIDSLMRTVGELIVARGALPLLAQKISEGADSSVILNDVKEAGTTVSHIADELQEIVMQIRMMPIKNVLQRFPRMIRDQARKTGKEIQLILEGEETELDKTVLEQIGDPLVHVIRNAADHGIETPDARKEAGKPTQGTVRVSVYRQAVNMVIDIIDDGKGMDAEVLKKKAMEKGLISEEQAHAMTEYQAFQLVLMPGFSTAAEVTDISGRGVGMDVVKTNLAKLHGAVSIKSVKGKGSTFSIKLPTSLLVSQGILIVCGSEKYIFPNESVQEMIKLPANKLRTYRDNRFAQIRDHVIPIDMLSELLSIPDAVNLNDDNEYNIAVLKTGNGLKGVVIDRFLDQVEVIIKPLHERLAHLQFFQGASIMGDGQVVLVIDPATL